MFKNHRDLMGFILAASIIPVIWCMQAYGFFKFMPEEVTGATIAIEMLIVQFYFRKKEGE